MALTFTTTTPSGASVAAVAALIQSAWRDALVGHASGAWTLVEEFDSAGATVHHVVIKNATAISGVGVDFFIVLSRRTADGELRISVGESYTMAGHVLGVYGASASSSPTSINANGTYTAVSYTLAAVLPGISGTASDPKTGYTGNYPPAASTVKCTTYVTEKMAILSHYLAATSAMTFANAIGNFGDTLIVPPSVDQPIIGMVDLVSVSGSANLGALTRHPVEAADATMKYAQQIWTPQPANFLVCGLNQIAVRTGNYFGGDRFQGGRVAACEVAIVMFAPFQNAAGATPSNQSGALRGKFRGLRYAAFDPVGVPGDTVVIDGHKHMMIGKQGQGGQLSAGVSNAMLALVMDTGA